MCRQSWRGNVRELQNTVERAVLFAGHRPVQLADLALSTREVKVSPDYPQDLRAATREFERQHIMKTLATTGNNKVAAAEALGIGLSSLYRKLDELEISKTHESAPLDPAPRGLHPGDRPT
jgi:DNA-binding NtrC family response regulator